MSSTTSVTTTPVTTPATGTGSSVTGRFSPTGSLAAARAAHTATLLANGKVLVAGGSDNTFHPLASAELYDPSTGVFTATGSMISARSNHAATLLGNGKVLVVGGFSDRITEIPIASAELYDPSTGAFTPTGSMTTAQPWVLATLLQDGRVFVAGQKDAEIYDLASGAFTPTGAFVNPAPVIWITIDLLPDGRVLLTGCTLQCTVGATELFDPKTKTFSTTGPMPGYSWINENSAIELTDGRVLFVGNAENDGSTANAEIYDPAAGTFTSIGMALAPHEFAAAVRLVDGTALITGGQLPGGSGSAETELYLPATGTFGSPNNMTTPRHSHTATLLSDGTVLVVGGYNGWPIPTASAEIYHP